MTAPDPTARLRAAAHRLEQAGVAATPGPWRVEDQSGTSYGDWWYIAADALSYGYVAGSGYEGGGVLADAEWIALLDPRTAPLLAGIFRDHADNLDLVDRLCGRPYPGDNDRIVALADLILEAAP